jgi:RNA polymerase sigma-70 factor (ECF subfamily)
MMDHVEAREISFESLLALRQRFLGFLRQRVADEATAEDILQSAYLKAVAHQDALEAESSVVAWFYRILRNAVIDHYRRTTTKNAAHENYAKELSPSYELELEAQICSCVHEVIEELKPAYREVIQQIDLGDQTVVSFARTHDTTQNNASVRLHRARKAIAKQLTSVCGACAEHKCLDCSCRRARV